MNIQARNFPKAVEIVEATGLTVTYPYEDLIFVEHNPFLLRFNDENPNQIFIHFNKDCYKEDVSRLKLIMELKAETIGMKAIYSSSYSISQKENTNEIEIAFQDK